MFSHFTFEVFDSPDEPGSGKRHMNHEFIRRLDIAKSCADECKGEDFTFKIKTGYLTQSYNKKQSGIIGSPLTKGIASIIEYDTEEDLKILLKCLIKVGFTRFGIRWKNSGNSVYVDSDNSKPKYKIWGYEDDKGNIVDPPNPWNYV